MAEDLREKAAQASGGYSDEDWSALVASADPFDQCTVTNARAVAANILALPEIKEALARMNWRDDWQPSQRLD